MKKLLVIMLIFACIPFFSCADEPYEPGESETEHIHDDEIQYISVGSHGDWMIFRSFEDFFEHVTIVLRGTVTEILDTYSYGNHPFEAFPSYEKSLEQLNKGLRLPEYVYEAIDSIRTPYIFTVEEVIYNGLDIKIDSEVLISIRGGRYLIYENNTEFEFLEKNGEYILFLNYKDNGINEPFFYPPSAMQGIYKIENNVPLVRREDMLSYKDRELKKGYSNANELIGEISNAVAKVKAASETAK